MKKNLPQNTKVLGALVLVAISGLLVLTGCDSPVGDETKNLAVPANVTITVEGRTMTVSWDAVQNAQGYEIYTTSVGCGSGNKIINTKNNTATNHAGEGSYIKDDKSNGAVEILTAASIEITLMPRMMGDQNVPMASAVTAKVRALGGEGYNDSDYSKEEEFVISSGGM